jgi:hypothetical protein
MRFVSGHEFKSIGKMIEKAAIRLKKAWEKTGFAPQNV